MATGSPLIDLTSFSEKSFAAIQKGDVLMDEGHLILLTIWFDPLELAARQRKMANGTSPYTYRALGHDLAAKIRIEAAGILERDALARWRNTTKREMARRGESGLRQDLLDFFNGEIPSIIKKVPEGRLHEFIEGVTAELAPF